MTGTRHVPPLAETQKHRRPSGAHSLLHHAECTGTVPDFSPKSCRTTKPAFSGGLLFPWSRRKTARVPGRTTAQSLPSRKKADKSVPARRSRSRSVQRSIRHAGRKERSPRHSPWSTQYRRTTPALATSCCALSRPSCSPAGAKPAPRGRLPPDTVPSPDMEAFGKPFSPLRKSGRPAYESTAPLHRELRRRSRIQAGLFRGILLLHFLVQGRPVDAEQRRRTSRS